MKRKAAWLAILGAAVAVAGSLALVELARSWPVWLASWGRDARRSADPSALPDQFSVPLHRVSRTHVVVAGAAVAVGLANWQGPRGATTTVLLDTGASIPLLTSDGARLLRPETADRLGVKVDMRGSDGHRVTVMPLSEDERLLLTLPGRTGAGPVYTPVWYAVADSLHDAHVIAPPTHLAPKGGAVRLDLRTSALVVCESLESCRPGKGWTRLARRACDKSPELVAVDAAVNDKPARLMLDTGGSTKLFAAFYAQAGLVSSEVARSAAALVGAGGVPADVIQVRGEYRLALGVDAPVRRHAPEMLVAQPRDRAGGVACFPDGALGLDALEGCEIVLTEATPRRGYLRCP